jgi:carboxyl-terminal processing protease
MTLASRDGRVFIAEVMEGGPARDAGIRPGDELVSVDSAPVAGMGAEEVVGRVRGEVGTTVVLVVRREGMDHPVALARVPVKF